MSRRALVIGDRVVIHPDAIEDLEREGYCGVLAHVEARIDDTWMNHGRRVFLLDRGAQINGLSTPLAVWASQVILADGQIERARQRAEAHVAALVAAKAEREVARMAKLKRRKRK